MLFISAEFAVFLCIVIPLFFLAPQRFKIPYLLLVSLIFYVYSHPPYVLLLLATTLIDFAIARRIAKSDAQRVRRRWLLVSLAINVGVLVLFKYAGFLNQIFADVLNALNIDSNVYVATPTEISLLMPLGISFYTFTKIAYVVDIYRKKYEPENNPITFATFVSFFPNVISGPIERADHLIPQLKAQIKFDETRVVEGFRLILWGAFKKVVIADRLVVYIAPVYNDPQAYQGLALITATLFLAFQIYADFSGYTDIARGVARVLGIDLFENFQQPYFAKSVLEFWRRWHMSLTSWIREYLFFPLSRFLLVKANRRYPRVIEVTVYLIVMSVVGLWHGANWTFIVWGLLHGIYMGAESLLNARRIRLVPSNRWGNAVKVLTMFLLVTFAWIFFRANSLPDALYIVGSLFNFGGDYPATFSVYTIPDQGYLVQLLLCVSSILLLLGADWIASRENSLKALFKRSTLVRWALYYAAAALILLALVSVNVVQEFVYFRF